MIFTPSLSRRAATIAITSLLFLVPALVFAQSYPCQLIVEHKGGNTYELDRVNGANYCDSVLEDFGYEIGERFELAPEIAAFYGITGSYTVVYNNIDDEGVIETDDVQIIPSVLDEVDDEDENEEDEESDSETSGTNSEDTDEEADEMETSTEDEEVRALQLQVIMLLQQLVDILSERMSIPQEPASVTGNPVAVFDTSLGTVKVELYEDLMPVTVGNFVDLAEADFYHDTKFHRVISGFMIQAGDPNTKTDDTSSYGTGGPGYTIDDEFVADDLLSNVRGTISMANTGHPNSGGSQFFINVVDNVNLDFDQTPLTSKHPVFGVVVSGMDVVDTIADVATDVRDLPTEAVVIHSVVIE